MTVQLDQRPLTVAEYHKMVEVGILTEDDRLELLNGQMIFRSPILILPIHFFQFIKYMW